MPPEQVPSLVDAAGNFLRRPTLLVRLLSGQVQLAELTTEIDAQVERYLSTGLLLSHINGDQHVHIFPRVGELVLQRAESLGAGTRITNERLYLRGAQALAQASTWKTLAVKAGLKTLSRSFSSMSRDCGVPTNDTLISTFGILPYRPPCATDLLRLLGSLELGVTELMVHPAFPEESVAQLWRSERLAHERQLEFQALAEVARTDLLRNGGLVLTTYSELLHS